MGISSDSTAISWVSTIVPHSGALAGREKGQEPASCVPGTVLASPGGHTESFQPPHFTEEKPNMTREVKGFLSEKSNRWMATSSVQGHWAQPLACLSPL